MIILRFARTTLTETDAYREINLAILRHVGKTLSLNQNSPADFFTFMFGLSKMVIKFYSGFTGMYCSIGIGDNTYTITAREEFLEVEVKIG